MDKLKCKATHPSHHLHYNTYDFQIHYIIFVFICIFQKILFIFRERGRNGEREEEKHQCVVASHMAPTGDLAHNPGMCPDRESNRQPFDSQPTFNPLSYTSQSNIYTFIVFHFLFHLHPRVNSVRSGSLCLFCLLEYSRVWHSLNAQ